MIRIEYISFKQKVVHTIIDKLKKGELDKSQKQKLYEIVIGLNTATENQKRRFLLYYQLMPGENKKETLSSIAKEKECSSSAVRYSLLSITNKLVNVKDEKIFHLLEEMSGLN